MRIIFFLKKLPSLYICFVYLHQRLVYKFRGFLTFLIDFILQIIDILRLIHVKIIANILKYSGKFMKQQLVTSQSPILQQQISQSFI